MGSSHTQFKHAWGNCLLTIKIPTTLAAAPPTSLYKEGQGDYPAPTKESLEYGLKAHQLFESVAQK